MRIASSLTLIAAALCSGTVFAQANQQDGQWRGAVTGALSISSGNTKSTSFSLGADASRATKDDKWSIYATSLYGKRDDGATGSTKTADNVRAGTRYDYNLTPLIFGFGLLELERDKLIDLDLRSTIGLGLGYHVIQTKETTFDVFAGLASTRSKFSDRSSTATELLLGEESSHKISETTSFKQKLTIYPNLKDSGEYRSVFDAGLSVAMSKNMALTVGLQNKYNSEAPAGTKKSDTLLITGVSVKFGP